MLNGVAVQRDARTQIEVSQIEILCEYARNENIIDPKVRPGPGDSIQVEHCARRHDYAPACTILGIIVGRVLLWKREQEGCIEVDQACWEKAHLNSDMPFVVVAATDGRPGVQVAGQKVVHPHVVGHIQEIDQLQEIHKNIVVRFEHEARRATMVGDPFQAHNVLVRHVPVTVHKRSLDNILVTGILFPHLRHALQIGSDAKQKDHFDSMASQVEVGHVPPRSTNGASLVNIVNGTVYEDEQEYIIIVTVHRSVRFALHVAHVRVVVDELKVGHVEQCGRIVGRQ